MGGKHFEIDLNKPCPQGLENIMVCGQRVDVNGLAPICALAESTGCQCPQVLIMDIASDSAETAGLPPLG